MELTFDEQIAVLAWYRSQIRMIDTYLRILRQDSCLTPGHSVVVTACANRVEGGSWRPKTNEKAGSAS